MRTATLEVAGGILNDQIGRIVISLHRNASPKAIENFKHLIEKPTAEEVKQAQQRGEPLTVQGPDSIQLPSLRGSTIGRVINNETIEFGTSSMKSVFGGFYESENVVAPNNDLLFKHDRAGILSVNNIGPNTNASKYIITLNPMPSLDGQHVILGRVTQGMEVLNRIGKCRLTPQGVPKEKITVKGCAFNEASGNVGREGRDGPARRPEFRSGGIRKRDDDEEEAVDEEGEPTNETEEQRTRRFEAQGGTAKRKRGEHFVRDSATGELERVTTAIPTAGGDTFDLYQSQAMAFDNNIEDIAKAQKERMAKHKKKAMKQKRFTNKLNPKKKGKK